MTASLSTKAKELINRPVLANVATVDEHDHPQLTPVWIDLDDGELVFNTARGRAKDRNLARNPSVAVSVVDPNDPYNVVVVRGTAEPTEEGADAHIDSLAKKYLGVEKYPMRTPGEVRIKYRVHPQHVVMQPGDEPEG
jgi:PPOX class probable F420-dependent enzyme